MVLNGSLGLMVENKVVLCTWFFFIFLFSFVQVRYDTRLLKFDVAVKYTYQSVHLTLNRNDICKSVQKEIDWPFLLSAYLAEKFLDDMSFSSSSWLDMSVPRYLSVHKKNITIYIYICSFSLEKEEGFFYLFITVFAFPTIANALFWKVIYHFKCISVRAFSFYRKTHLKWK
jgi:hypothetical protein